MKNFLIIGLSLSLLMACGEAEQSIAGEAKAQNYSWSLVTTWPKNYPGLGMAPERFSKLVEENCKDAALSQVSSKNLIVL